VRSEIVCRPAVSFTGRSTRPRYDQFNVAGYVTVWRYSPSM
jgi:hypothetical protein